MFVLQSGYKLQVTTVQLGQDSRHCTIQPQEINMMPTLNSPMYFIYDGATLESLAEGSAGKVNHTYRLRINEPRTSKEGSSCTLQARYVDSFRF